MSVALSPISEEDWKVHATLSKLYENHQSNLFSIPLNYNKCGILREKSERQKWKATCSF